MHVQLREEGEVDEAGAVHTFGAEAAVAVGYALPVFFWARRLLRRKLSEVRSSAVVLSSFGGWGWDSWTGGVGFVAQAVRVMQRSIVAESLVRETGFTGMGSM